jgi:hypothetical protein
MTPHTLSPNRVEMLIAEHKLLCILKPQLRNWIRQYQGHNPFVVQYDNQIYLSLAHIEDKKQREYYYQLIQCYQSGQEVNLITLPVEFQRILQPESQPQPLFWGPLILGGIVGLAAGVLAMAVSMLFWNATAVTFGTAEPELFNVQVPALIFVFFAAFGWAVTSFIAWHRMKNTANIRK